MSKAKPSVMLFSHICSPDHITGAEKMLLFIATELNNRVDCLLVVPGEGMLAEEARRAGIATLVQPFPLLYDVYHPSPALPQLAAELQKHPASAQLIDLMLIRQPDVVIVNTCVNALPAAAAKKAGIPVIWIIAEVIQSNAFTSHSIDLIHRSTDCIAGISHATLQPFQGHPAASKTIVLPPSWQPEQFHPSLWPFARNQARSELGLCETDTVIGYISSDIYANKGLDHFIQMGITLCAGYPDTRFLMVGKPVDPFYMEQCMKLIEKSGYASRFMLAPFHPDIERLYPAMDIVVIPSLLSEGFGLTALEGLIFGKPVVAYRSGGLAEVLTSTGNEAFLAAPGDIAELTARVGQLAADRGLRQTVGERNRESVRQVFGLQAFRQRLEQLLMEITRLADQGWPAVPPFGEGALLKGESSQVIFCLQAGSKRPIQGEETFRFYRLRSDRVTVVPDAQLRAFASGAPVIATEPIAGHAPSRFVARGSGPTVYLLLNGRKHAVPSVRALHREGFAMENVVPLSDAALAAFPAGPPLADAARIRGHKRLRLRRGRVQTGGVRASRTWASRARVGRIRAGRARAGRARAGRARAGRIRAGRIRAGRARAGGARAGGARAGRARAGRARAGGARAGRARVGRGRAGRARAGRTRTGSRTQRARSA
ncbi:glycosyltransferase [Paenibacillus athensensis]|uniref:glycosyltransferase family 4 protein n=1 Tax=Paenibacillus athensensis TaxID=1967502 RepID=UPI001E4B2558|nr:glycosyltransferase [Paenibacillus athensensis]MCD1258079.1 glycosyltransferase [Paenibacillus athensensis]